MKEKLRLGAFVALGLILVTILVLACAPEEAIPRSYSCAVYTEQGCAKFVVASGGEIEIQSGGTFDLQSGATVDFSGGVDLDGSTLTFDADGDTTMVASQDDVITATITSTTYIVIANGNLKVGNGAPTVTQNGEDAYVEGVFEVDGATYLDGALDVDGNISSSAGMITMTDNLIVDGAANVEQLIVQGYTTQTNSILVVESSAGTDIFEVTTSQANLNNNPLVNVGASGTDFGTDGSLTVAQTVTVSAGNVVAPAGAAGSPSYTFASDTDSGLYRVGANNIGIAISNTLVSDWTTTTLDMNNVPISNVGAAGTDFGTDGSLTVAQTVTVSAGNVVAPAGAAGSPGYTFASDTDSGLYRVGANNVGVAVSGTLISDWSTSSLDMNNLPVLNVGAAGTDFGADGSLTMAQTVTITTGGLDIVNGDMNVNDFIVMDPATAIDCTSSIEITPTGSYQQLTASAMTTPTMATSNGFVTGTLVILVNTGTSSIVMQDSGTLMLNTTRTMGQYDAMTLLFDGTNWLELSYNDN